MRIKITSYTLCNWTQTGRRCSKNLLVDRTLFLHFKLLYCFKASGGIQLRFFLHTAGWCHVTRHVGWRSCLDLERKSRLWFRKFLGTCSWHCMGWALCSSNQRTQELSVVRLKYQNVYWEICHSWCSDVMLFVGQRAVVTASWVCGNKYQILVDTLRTLPQTYTTVVAIQLFDTIRQVSENGE